MMIMMDDHRQVYWLPSVFPAELITVHEHCLIFNVGIIYPKNKLYIRVQDGHKYNPSAPDL